MHHISAQNEGKHVLATSIFHNFLTPPCELPPSASKTTATRGLRLLPSHSLPTNQLESSASSHFRAANKAISRARERQSEMRANEPPGIGGGGGDEKRVC